MYVVYTIISQAANANAKCGVAGGHRQNHRRDLSDRDIGAVAAIPVTRVSNGKGGWTDLILTKDSRPPPLSHQYTAEMSSLVKLIPAVIAMSLSRHNLIWFT